MQSVDGVIVSHLYLSDLVLPLVIVRQMVNEERKRHNGSKGNACIQKNEMDLSNANNMHIDTLRRVDRTFSVSKKQLPKCQIK